MGRGACLYCSLHCWVFNKLAKLTSLGLWLLLLDHTANGRDCLLDSTSPPPPRDLPRAEAAVLGTGEAQQVPLVRHHSDFSGIQGAVLCPVQTGTSVMAFSWGPRGRDCPSYLSFYIL